MLSTPSLHALWVYVWVYLCECMCLYVWVYLCVCKCILNMCIVHLEARRYQVSSSFTPCLATWVRVSHWTWNLTDRQLPHPSSSTSPVPNAWLARFIGLCNHVQLVHGCWGFELRSSHFHSKQFYMWSHLLSIQGQGSCWVMYPLIPWFWTLSLFWLCSLMNFIEA